MEHTKTWAIMDANGIVYDGTEEEMRHIFSQIGEGSFEPDPHFEWYGDIRLIEIHAVTR